MDTLIVGKTTDFLVSQGLLGVVCIALTWSVVYLWRDGRKQRTDFDESMVEERTRHNEEVLAERTRHAVELAAERKANAELQDKRFVELKAANETVTKALAILDATLSALKGSRHEPA